ncbi:MAG TPA: sensor histidine kinase [Bacillota bacterium]|nr:sensor histidine kinase [Bacillota bacterium]
MLQRRPAAPFPGKVFFSRLANKLSLTFAVTISVFITVIIAITYHRTNNILLSEVINANKSILLLLDRNYRDYLTQIDELSITFRKDAQLMEVLTTGSRDYASRNYLENQLKIVFYSRKDLEELQFYLPGANILYTISQSNDKLQLQSGRDFTKTAWYQKTIHGEYFRYIQTPAGKQQGKVFCIFNRALVSIPGWKPLSVVSFSLNRAVLDKLVFSTLNQPGEVLFIYDRTNGPFYCSDIQLTQTGADLVRQLSRFPGVKGGSGYCLTKVQNRQYLAVCHSAENSEWKFVKLIPLELIQDKVRQTRNLSLLIGGVFITVFIGLIIIVTNTITRPLRRLADEMDKVGEGNFNVKVEVGGSYELVRLAEEFNRMVDRINQLINEKYQAQINEKTARLKALEAQINPHFLYNSLQAIAAKTTLGGMKEISRMVENLAYILRYCIKGGEQVTIAQEMQHIQKYLQLQKVRFEERLAVAIEVADESAGILIPKLSIQTLVENAIQHALEQMSRTIKISIRIFFRDEQLLITVSDNGPGMTELQLQRVNALMGEDALATQVGESLGLKNLNSRLKLMYGEQARLIFKSVWGQGTEATMLLPLPTGGTKDV